MGETRGARSLFHFDSAVRSKILGFKSVHSLYRYISCDPYLPHIKTPFLTVVARDDPITSMKFVPVDTLNRNENCLLTVLDKGGHVEYYTGD
jgi:predicted alpha/beta-fold hydrolase